jgi:hypothetical protein
MKKTCKNIKYQTFLKDKGITDILEKHRWTHQHFSPLVSFFLS